MHDTIERVLGDEWQITYDDLGRVVQKTNLTLQSAMISNTQDVTLVADYITKKTPQLFIVDAIVTREGIYPYPEHKRTEAKLGEELKKGVSRLNVIPAWDHHPPYGVGGLEAFLGQVPLTYDPTPRAVRAKIKFLREFLEGHDPLLDAVQSRKPFPVSIGQTNKLGPAGVLGNERYDVSQIDVVFNHLAVLTDGSEPRCPLGSCGLNVDRKPPCPKPLYEILDYLSP